MSLHVAVPFGHRGWTSTNAVRRCRAPRFTLRHAQTWEAMEEPPYEYARVLPVAGFPPVTWYAWWLPAIPLAF